MLRVSENAAELREARRQLTSLLHKNEKACATMAAKQTAPGTLTRVAANIGHLRVLLAVLAEALGEDADGSLTAASVQAAGAAIPGFIAQIERVLPKFAEGTPQYTLAVRRVAAYRTAEALIRERALGGSGA